MDRLSQLSRSERPSPGSLTPQQRQQRHSAANVGLGGHHADLPFRTPRSNEQSNNSKYGSDVPTTGRRESLNHQPHAHTHQDKLLSTTQTSFNQKARGGSSARPASHGKPSAQAASSSDRSGADSFRNLELHRELLELKARAAQVEAQLIARGETPSASARSSARTVGSTPATTASSARFAGQSASRGDDTRRAAWKRDLQQAGADASYSAPRQAPRPGSAAEKSRMGRTVARVALNGGMATFMADTNRGESTKRQDPRNAKSWASPSAHGVTAEHRMRPGARPEDLGKTAVGRVGGTGQPYGEGGHWQKMADTRFW